MGYVEGGERMMAHALAAPVVLSSWGLAGGPAWGLQQLAALLVTLEPLESVLEEQRTDVSSMVRWTLQFSGVYF